jgi:hypothetical protein
MKPLEGGKRQLHSHLTSVINFSFGTTCFRPHFGHHPVNISSVVQRGVGVRRAVVCDHYFHSVFHN